MVTASKYRIFYTKFTPNTILNPAYLYPERIVEKAVERMPAGLCDQLEAGTEMALPFRTGCRRNPAGGRSICNL
jgi:hypothetical protein